MINIAIITSFTCNHLGTPRTRASGCIPHPSAMPLRTGLPRILKDPDSHLGVVRQNILTLTFIKFCSYLNAVPDDIGSGLLKPTYDLGARIYSISWGTEDNTYTTTSASIDKFVAENDDLLVLVAAGNDGEGKYGPVSFTVGSPATAKNILAVGSSWNSLNAALEYSTGDPSGLGNSRKHHPHSLHRQIV